MPGLTPKQYAELLARNPTLRPTEEGGVGNKGVSCPGKKELILSRSEGKNLDRPRSKRKGGKNHKRFRITATFFYSDELRRDGDGAYTTIQDCIIVARGRLVDMDTRTQR